jgi:predicted  nucleic acid-binding Zn-ribbon protein
MDDKTLKERVQQLEKEVQVRRHMFDTNTEALHAVSDANYNLGKAIKKLQSKIQIAKGALNAITENSHSTRNGLQDIAYEALEKIK